MMGKVALRVECRCTTLTRSGNGLPVGPICNITGSEHPRNVGVGMLMLDKVTVRIHVQLPFKGRGVGGVADCDENAFQLQFAFRPRHGVLQPYATHLAF